MHSRRPVPAERDGLRKFPRLPVRFQMKGHSWQKGLRSSKESKARVYQGKRAGDLPDLLVCHIALGTGRMSPGKLAPGGGRGGLRMEGPDRGASGPGQDGR